MREEIQSSLYDEGDDTITFETLYSYHGDDVIDFNNPSVTLDLSLGISVHEIAGDKKGN